MILLVNENKNMAAQLGLELQVARGSSDTAGLSRSCLIPSVEVEVPGFSTSWYSLKVSPATARTLHESGKQRSVAQCSSSSAVKNIHIQSH